ncbi:DUF1566 domain-containing protein [Desulfovibrio sulfodismutans]|uniref:DUF1566 domain-containing protein n=1 Tax=Desulfolutivibrio sulfodismutans TaxID=63561 RepID=A0A7K3NHA5_9BACT|nr:DUF1566 domain-containing protein [Desulfolutivibrio sulfodismutans]NDY55568.1 DUF1566 domain-containing protein [Desulfolutivibrio sulfodismutans]QLA11470.1 DUF1566 domain-containing protein [Desulfolutivibrio sulfodismutans DSM 3696]
MHHGENMRHTNPNVFKRISMQIFLCGVLSVLLMTARVHAYTLPSTGQVKCYNDLYEIACPAPGEDYYGQDGNYQRVPMSYQDNGNGTVTDLVTGLVWEQSDGGTKRTWENAVGHCQNLDFAGQSDWRLPTWRELTTIVDINRVFTPPVINPVFQCTETTGNYWANTTYVGQDNAAWMVYFGGGGAYNYNKTDWQLYSRCVRGNALDVAAYVDNGDGTITDTTTSLIWEQNGSPNPLVWKEALAWCENLSIGTKTAWRLPSIRELESLLDTDRTSPRINPLFSCAAEQYTTGTTEVHDDNRAWYVDFNNGFVAGGALKTFPFRFRCVHDATAKNPSYNPSQLLLFNE